MPGFAPGSIVLMSARLWSIPSMRDHASRLILYEKPAPPPGSSCMRQDYACHSPALPHNIEVDGDVDSWLAGRLAHLKQYGDRRVHLESIEKSKGRQHVHRHLHVDLGDTQLPGCGPNVKNLRRYAANDYRQGGGWLTNESNPGEIGR